MDLAAVGRSDWPRGSGINRIIENDWRINPIPAGSMLDRYFESLTFTTRGDSRVSVKLKTAP
jgi:hypothetical protein